MSAQPVGDDPRDATALARSFEQADRRYGPVPIWWWSGGRLDRARLRWQMEQLCSQGVMQAVVMCLAPRGPLYGSLADDPAFFSEAWWEIFLGACADAHDLGFRFFLYDQFGFSGANVQGQLVAAHPHWAGQELVRADFGVSGPTVIRFPAGSAPIGAYVAGPGEPGPPFRERLEVADGAVRWAGGEGWVRLYYAEPRGFDYYDGAACAALIDTVLGEFRRRAERWFGSVITGLFQDELPHMPTWGRDFAASFAQRHGYDIQDRIASLWDGDGDEDRRVRRDYHAHRAELARRAFFTPYAAWAEAAGLVAGFDQQSPAREGDPPAASSSTATTWPLTGSSPRQATITGAIRSSTARWPTPEVTRAPGWRHFTHRAGAGPSRRPTTG